MTHSSLRGGSANNFTSNNSAARILQAFLCAGRWATWQSTPQYFTNLQALHDFKLTTALPQAAQLSILLRWSMVWVWVGNITFEILLTLCTNTVYKTERSFSSFHYTKVRYNQVIFQEQWHCAHNIYLHLLTREKKRKWKVTKAVHLRRSTRPAKSAIQPYRSFLIMRGNGTSYLI